MPLRMSHSCATCHMSHKHVTPLVTGQKHIPGHLHIPGVMETPARLYVDAPRRRSLKLAVACCKTGGVFIKELSGTTYDGRQPTKEYLNAKGKGYSSMGAAEYMDFLKDAWAHFMRNPKFRASRHLAMLMHDRFKVHQAKLVQEGLLKMRVKAELQPPRSPDLQPLDYGIFGAAKTKLGRAARCCRKWEERVAMFTQILLAIKPGPIIDQFPLRLEACIQANGGHIEKHLSKLKKSTTVA